jgi:hypothetical protein
VEKVNNDCEQAHDMHTGTLELFLFFSGEKSKTVTGNIADYLKTVTAPTKCTGILDVEGEAVIPLCVGLTWLLASHCRIVCGQSLGHELRARADGEQKKAEHLLCFCLCLSCSLPPSLLYDGGIRGALKRNIGQ